MTPDMDTGRFNMIKKLLETLDQRKENTTFSMLIFHDEYEILRDYIAALKFLNTKLEEEHGD